MHSLATRWIAFALCVAGIATAAATWISLTTASQALQADVMQRVELAARAQRDALDRRLSWQHARADNLLQVLRRTCADGQPDPTGCAERLLRLFVELEEASGGRLRGIARQDITIGRLRAADDSPRGHGQIAQFMRLADDSRVYRMQTRHAGVTLDVEFPIDVVAEIFERQLGLGASAETFLADREGAFITAPKYGSADEHSHPVDAEPMRHCLAGRNGHAIAPDYRGVVVIHGFRFVRSIGGGCVMAHVARSEAFAPIAALRNRMLATGSLAMGLAALGALLLARRTSKPLNALTERARMLQAGDFDSPFPAGGASELRLLSTTLARMARSLRASELRARSVIDNALDAVIGIDGNDLVIDWSSRAEQLFGWERREALGQPLHQLVIPERLRAAHVGGIRHFLATGAGPVLNRRVEVTALHRDGHEFPIELTVTPLRSGDGWLFHAFARDLTETRRAAALERFMTEASTLLAESLDFDTTIGKVARLAVTALADLCTVTVRRDDGTLERVAVAFSDGDAEALVTRLIEQHLPAGGAHLGIADVLESGMPRLEREFDPAHVAALAAGDPEVAEAARRFAPASYLAVPMRASGRVTGVIALLTTRRSVRHFSEADLAIAMEFGRRCGVALENARLFDDARRAIEVRDEFLSIASHELRTPLSPLLLQVQLIQRRIEELVTDAAARGWLQTRLTAVHGHGLRIKRLIDELLDVARLKQGEVPIELERVDLGAVVDEVVQALIGDRTIAEDRVATTLPAAPIVGCWDRLRVQQIAHNLLVNAARYSEGTPISVIVSRSDDTASLVVRDSGPGIAAADLARVFEPLERAASARHYGGLGLGLYVSRRVAEAMGGCIELVSSPGEGAEFTLKLPLHPASGEATNGA